MERAGRGWLQGTRSRCVAGPTVALGVGGPSLCPTGSRGIGGAPRRSRREGRDPWPTRSDLSGEGRTSRSLPLAALASDGTGVLAGYAPPSGCCRGRAEERRREAPRPGAAEGWERGVGRPSRQGRVPMTASSNQPELGTQGRRCGRPSSPVGVRTGSASGGRDGRRSRVWEGGRVGGGRQGWSSPRARRVRRRFRRETPVDRPYLPTVSGVEFGRRLG